MDDGIEHVRRASMISVAYEGPIEPARDKHDVSTTMTQS